MRKKTNEAELARHIEEVLEYISEETEADVDFGAYLETLTDIADSPINLNRATAEELSALEGIITNKQINNLLTWREQAGKFF